MTPHWAHFGHKGDCDPWAEPETPWHRWWKLRAPPEYCEVSLGEHRADIKLPKSGLVVELQHSSIRAEEIQAREHFYRDMIWILDARTHTLPTYMFGMTEDRLAKMGEGVWKWRFPKRSFGFATMPFYLDLGAEVMHVKSMRDHVLVANKVSREQMLKFLDLRAVEADEKASVVSWVADWCPPLPRRRASGAVPDNVRNIW